MSTTPVSNTTPTPTFTPTSSTSNNTPTAPSAQTKLLLLEPENFEPESTDVRNSILHLSRIVALHDYRLRRIEHKPMVESDETITNTLSFPSKWKFEVDESGNLVLFFLNPNTNSFERHSTHQYPY